MIYIKNFLCFAGLLIVLGCNDNDQMLIMDFHKVYGGDNDDAASLLVPLSETNIYFGHRSVGNNILRGIEYWSQESGVPIEMIETTEFSGFDSPMFYHFNVGKNGNPYLKIDNYSKIFPDIKNDSGAVAFFKLCFGDVSETTDVDSLFSYFKENMLTLKDSYPHIKTILVTVPFTTTMKGIKALAKKILLMKDKGKYSDLDNVRRNEFNKRVIEELGGDFPVFDLGRVQATRPDGTLNTFKYNGKTYQFLYHKYADDPGHLNDLGSQIVAFNLISFLANEIGKGE